MIPADPTAFTPAAARSPAPATADARALIEAQMAMLSRLAEIGMDIAEACGRDAKSEPQSAREVGLVFARVARAVRMTIALQSRLMNDLAALDRGDAVAAMRRRDAHRIELRVLAGKAARAGVEARRQSGEAFWSDEDAIEDEIEQLSSEAYERLTDAEAGDLMGLTFDEAVAAICKDLRLSPEWSARVHAAVQPPPPPTSPIADAMGRGGPSAAELMVEGEGLIDTDLHQPAPSTPRSSAGGPMIGSSPIKPPPDSG